MNEFMNNLYAAGGATVTGYYQGAGFIGHITGTRAKSGTDIAVKVEVDLRESDVDYATLMIDGSTLYAGEGSAYKNLHVYFN